VNQLEHTHTHPSFCLASALGQLVGSSALCFVGLGLGVRCIVCLNHIYLSGIGNDFLCIYNIYIIVGIKYSYESK
jgi:hypothetical protein